MVHAGRILAWGNGPHGGVLGFSTYYPAGAKFILMNEPNSMKSSIDDFFLKSETLHQSRALLFSHQSYLSNVMQ